MEPRKILVFLVLILILVTGIALIFPKDGIAIGDHTQLKFHFSFQQLFNNEIKYADITEIIDENKSIITDDSLPVNNSIAFTDTLKADAKILKAKVQSIEYPTGDSTILYSFFNKLDNSNTKRVRILHYGDSQIEGDRITGYLRNNFQRQFGGSGPGLMSAISGNAESSSIIHLASSNWQTHSVYYAKDTILPHRQFGILGSFARFTSYKHDSLNNDLVPKKATIEFNRSGMAYSSVNNFTQCRVFYGNCTESLIVKGYVNDSLIWFEEVDTTKRTQKFQWNFAYPPKDFKIEFEGTKSPDVYGIALDATNGVAVDNLPFRGSSGTEFTRLEFAQMKKMANYLNSGLIIMEFGVNVVPNQVKSYSYYERAFTRQLNYLKNVFPNVPILVIGVSDISLRNGNNYESYPNIELLIEAQRNAAKNANCAFWNLYLAMGGKNSMPSWVFAEPALASKDFTHFNRKGGHIVAQMIYNALMKDYQQHKTKLNPSSLSVKQ